MCTRFYIEPETEEIKDIFEAARKTPLSERFIRSGAAIRTAGEIRPSEVVAAIAPSKSGAQTVFPMKWGFQIPGYNLIVNARAESASEKPLFKDSWKSRRCAIPASWYFEWEHFKTPSGKTKAGAKYAILPRRSKVSWLCGLYRIEDELPVFTILTREPSASVARIHDRMPLILPGDCIRDWIDPRSSPEDLLQYALTDMVCEKV